MNFDILFENDLIKKYCGQSPEVSNQSETAEDGKNASWIRVKFVDFRCVWLSWGEKKMAKAEKGMGTIYRRDIEIK